MSASEKPTMPPSGADEAASRFAAKLAELERTRRRTESGLLRALATAWAATQVPR